MHAHTQFSAKLGTSVLLALSLGSLTATAQNSTPPPGAVLPNVLYGAAYYNEYIPAALQPDRLERDTAGTTPEQIIAFRPFAMAQQRVEELIAREKDDHLSPDEQSELDYFFQLEHILRVAKARAEQIMTRAS
jgi:hypothetical protein